MRLGFYSSVVFAALSAEKNLSQAISLGSDSQAESKCMGIGSDGEILA